MQEFLRGVADLEQEGLTTERHYTDQYRLFAKLWKDILTDKKEINARQAELKKVRAAAGRATAPIAHPIYLTHGCAPQLRATRDAVEKRVAGKGDADSADKRRLELAPAVAREKEAADAVAAKLLEAQQDKHEMLRAGFRDLHVASRAGGRAAAGGFWRWRRRLCLCARAAGERGPGHGGQSRGGV